MTSLPGILPIRGTGGVATAPASGTSKRDPGMGRDLTAEDAEATGGGGSGGKGASGGGVLLAVCTAAVWRKLEAERDLTRELGLGVVEGLRPPTLAVSIDGLLPMLDGSDSDDPTT